MSRLRDRAPLRLRAAAASRASRRSSSRARRRYVGEHGTTWIDEQVFVDRPGEWLADQVRGQARRRLRPRLRDDGARLPRARRRRRDRRRGTSSSTTRARSRASSSSSRCATASASTPRGSGSSSSTSRRARREREILAHCEKYFVEQGCGRLTMDMVLVGDERRRAARVQDRGRLRGSGETDMVLPSLEVAGPGGHWVEVSRAICAGEPSDETKQMMEAYEEYYDAARSALRDGATAHDVHRAVSKGFLDRGFKLGHVTGHSIGMTMIEWPKIGEGDETELRRDMVLLDAPARDLGRRPGVPLHAGHLARDGGRRRAARGPADEDLRRNGEPSHERVREAGPAGRGRFGLRALPAHRRAAARCRRGRTSGCTATSCCSRRCTSRRSCG